MTVNLVQNRDKFYPHTDADYTVLREAKIPVSVIDENFIPLLVRTSRLYNLDFRVVNFDDLESAMFNKAKERWPFELETSKKEIILKAPKNINTERLDKFVTKFRVWYAQHGITLDMTPKRGAKTLKVTLRKRELV